jgi:hypothetical protein
MALHVYQAQTACGRLLQSVLSMANSPVDGAFFVKISVEM